MTPPRLTRALLRWFTASAHREEIDGDLTEWFAREVRVHPRAARRRYRRLVLTTLFDRIRRSSGEPPEEHRAMFDVFRSDFQQALRTARVMPVQTAAVALMLACAIGAVVSVTTIVDTFLFKPLAYNEPDRVVFLLGWETQTDELRFGVSPGDYAELRDAFARPNAALASVEAYRYRDRSVTGGSEPAWVPTYAVTPGTFPMLGVAPLIGRTFDASDLGSQSPPVVISYGLWQRLFGGDRSAVGRVVRVDDEARVVIGVMPASFEYPVINYKGDLWEPLEIDPVRAALNRKEGGSVVTVARLSRDGSLDAAQSQASAVMESIAKREPETNRGIDVVVRPMAEMLRREARAPLTALMILVSLLFVAATASASSMVIARGIARRSEIAVRVALGGSRRAIVRQLAIEATVPILLGGALGLGLAGTALVSLRRYLPPDLLRVLPNIDALTLDLRSALAVAGAGAAVLLFAAIVPGWRAAGAMTRESMTMRGPGVRAPRRLRLVLVAVEVAVSVVLVVTSLLLVRSVGAAADADLGFEPRQIETFKITLPAQRYPSDATVNAFVTEALDRLRSLPGVTRVGAANELPFSAGDNLASVRRHGGQDQEVTVGLRLVSSGYFETLGIRRVHGRVIEPSDREGTLPVAVVNRAVSDRLFGGASPVGHQLRLGSGATVTIVGMVDNVRHTTVTEASRLDVYLPFAQAPTRAVSFAAQVDPGVAAATGAALVAALHASDSTLPVFGQESLAARVRLSLFPQHFLAWVMSGFAVLAALVAFVGLYGVMSWMVASQRAEFATRLALGASPSSLFRLIMGRGLRLAGIGVFVGGGAAWLVTSLLSAVLVGIGPRDPFSFVLSFLVVAVSAVAACAGPARRAGRTDAMTSLRLG